VILVRLLGTEVAENQHINEWLPHLFGWASPFPRTGHALARPPIIDSGPWVKRGFPVRCAYLIGLREPVYVLDWRGDECCVPGATVH
jgi:hypothetical protein